MNLLKALTIALLLLPASLTLAQTPVSGKWKISSTAGLDESLPARPAEQSRGRYNRDAAALTFFSIVYKYTALLAGGAPQPCDLYLVFNENGKLETIRRCESIHINYSEGSWGYKQGEVELFGLSFFDEDVDANTTVFLDVDTIPANSIHLSCRISKKQYLIRLERVETTPADEMIFEEPVYTELDMEYEYDSLNPPPPPPPLPGKAGRQQQKEQQEKSEVDIYTITDHMPQFPGGDEAMLKFMSDSMVYPVVEKENDISGRVILRFVVEKDGTVSNAEILRSVSPGLDAEALRVVGLLPAFTPARQDGKPVRCYFTLPVLFKLQ